MTALLLKTLKMSNNTDSKFKKNINSLHPEVWQIIPISIFQY